MAEDFSIWSIDNNPQKHSPPFSFLLTLPYEPGLFGGKIIDSLCSKKFCEIPVETFSPWEI